MTPKATDQEDYMHLVRRSWIHAIVIACAFYFPMPDIAYSQNRCDTANCLYLPVAAVANVDEPSGLGLTLSKTQMHRYQDRIIIYAEAVNLASISIRSATITWIFRSAQNEIIHTMQTFLDAGYLDPGERFAFNAVYTGAPFEVQPNLEYLASWRTDEIPNLHEAQIPIEISNVRITVADYFGGPRPFLEATIQNNNPVTVTVQLQNLAVYSESEIELVIGFTGVCDGCNPLGPNQQINVSALLGEQYEPVDWTAIDPNKLVVYAIGHIQEQDCGTYCQ